jgi:hypothetical protein
MKQTQSHPLVYFKAREYRTSRFERWMGLGKNRWWLQLPNGRIARGYRNLEGVEWRIQRYLNQHPRVLENATYFTDIQDLNFQEHCDPVLRFAGVLCEVAVRSIAVGYEASRGEEVSAGMCRCGCGPSFPEVSNDLR